MAETVEEAIARAKPEHEELHRALMHLTAAVKQHRRTCPVTDPRGCGTERRLLHAVDVVMGLERELKASMLEAAEVLHG